MNKYSQKRKPSDIVPEAVNEFISEDLLPNLADGKTSAKSIAEQLHETGKEKVAEFYEKIDREDLNRDELYTEEAFLYLWIAEDRNLEILKGFIQQIFENWSMWYEEEEINC